MTYEKIFNVRAYTANQCCTYIDKEIQNFVKGKQSTIRKVWDLKTTGLSIYSRSNEGWGTDTNSRHKDCFYSQAIPETGKGTSTICKVQGSKIKRYSYTCTGSFTSQGSLKWRKGKNRIEISNWNTLLIDCHPKRSFKPTGF